VKKGLLSATANSRVAFEHAVGQCPGTRGSHPARHEAMRAIINEASGERALHQIMEFVPYVRVRPIDEYKGHFRESEAMVNFAKQYGYSTAEIESYPTTNVQFQGPRPSCGWSSPRSGTIRHLRCAHVPRGEPTGRRPHR